MEGAYLDSDLLDPGKAWRSRRLSLSWCRKGDGPPEKRKTRSNAQLLRDNNVGNKRHSATISATASDTDQHQFVGVPAC